MIKYKNYESCLNNLLKTILILGKFCTNFRRVENSHIKCRKTVHRKTHISATGNCW